MRKRLLFVACVVAILIVNPIPSNIAPIAPIASAQVAGAEYECTQYSYRYGPTDVYTLDFGDYITYDGFAMHDAPPEASGPVTIDGLEVMHWVSDTQDPDGIFTHMTTPQETSPVHFMDSWEDGVLTTVQIYNRVTWFDLSGLQTEDVTVYYSICRMMEPTPTPQWTQPEPPAACSQIPVPPRDDYTLDAGTQEYEAWSWNGTIRDVTTPPGTLLPRWYFDDPGARIGLEDHTFYNDDPDTYDRVIFCPVDMETPTPTPTPTPDAGRCQVVTAQTVTLTAYDDDGTVMDTSTHEVFLFPGYSGYTDVGYPIEGGFSLADSLIADAPLWYDIDQFMGYTYMPLNSDDVYVYNHYMRNGLEGYQTGFGIERPYYLEYRSWSGLNPINGAEYLTFIAVVPGSQMLVCEPRDDVGTVIDTTSCIVGGLEHMQAYPYGDSGRWLHVWDDSLRPWDYSYFIKDDDIRPAAEEKVYLNYNFRDWTIEAISTIDIDFVYDQSISDTQPDIEVAAGQTEVIDVDTTTVSIRSHATNPTFDDTQPVFQLCPPSDFETPTPSDTPTSTATPTSTPIPPVGCYVQPIRPDAPTRLQFAHPTDVYEWAGEINYTLSVTQSGGLEPFGQAALVVDDGDEVVFDPIQSPSQLLLCPPEVTPSPTPTIEPYDDPRCDVLHSAYDPSSALHRVNWASYGYMATTGGYNLALDEDHAYRIRALNGSVKMTIYQTSGAVSYNFLDSDDGFWDYPISQDYGSELSADDAGGAFSLQVCRDEPLPTETPTPTNTATETFTPLPAPTETPCISCEIRQTEAAAAPTTAAGMETMIALQQTVAVGIGTAVAEAPTLTPSNTPTYTPVPGPRARFDSTMYQVREAAEVVSVLVELSKAWNETVTVSYETEPGSALAGDDYTPTSGQLVFAPGEMSKVIDIPIVDDLIGEPDELFGIILTEVVNGFLGEYPASSILIQNDDSGAVTEEPDIPPECYAQDIYAPWTMLVLTDTREITTIGIYGVYLTPAELTGEASIWGYVATPFLGTVVPPGKYVAITLDVETALSMLADKELPGRLGDIAGLEESVTLQLCPVLAPTATAAAMTATAATSPTAELDFAYTPVPLDNSGIVSACIVAATPAPDLTGPQPQLDFSIPTMRPLPPIITSSYAITTAYTGYITSVETTVAAEWVEPAATMAAWSDTTFGPDAWAKGEHDGQALAVRVADAFGWLSVFSMIGALAWLLPPIVISVLVQIARAVLSVMAYIRGWMK